MLTFDLARLMESKEIQNPLQFLMKSGLTRHTASRLLHQNVASINYRNLEQLCLILNCTPNDLFSWTPDSKKNTDKTALQKLAGRTRKGSILGKLKTLPEDKLDQLRQLVDKLSEEG
ncbi:MAG: helix-turn-helix transcriptional regulator [Bacteroidetes bacterium]|nr:helix-turn-helix transcriptional regulator [Bacteroidota bacterium]MBI3482657.1 helix-turn-helix transcriptional regulator [Bacteroidota bacterium]